MLHINGCHEYVCCHVWICYGYKYALISIRWVKMNLNDETEFIYILSDKSTRLPLSCGKCEQLVQRE